MYLGPKRDVMDILKSLLEAIQSGQKSFKPVSQNFEDMNEFQTVAKALLFAEGEGYLDKCIHHRESSTSNSWYDLVFVQNGLSHKGAQYVSEPNALVEKRFDEEIVQLRPNFFGLGVDLRAAWRRWGGEVASQKRSAVVAQLFVQADR